MQALQGIRPLILTHGLDGELDAAAIGTEAVRQRLEEGQPIGRLRCGVAGEQGLCECHT